MPVSGDDVLFDGTGTKNATVNAGFAGAIKNLTITTGYTGTLTVARALTLSGALTQTAGGLNLGANITTAAGAVTTNAAVTLSANVAIDATNAGGSAAGANMAFTGTINADSAASNRTLTLTGGTAGAISLSAAVGDSQALQTFTIASGASAALPAITTRDGGVSVTATAITLNGAIATDNTTTAGAVSFTGAVSLGGTITIDSDAATTDANITFSTTVNGQQDLTLVAGGGAITCSGAVGGTTALQTFTITSSASASLPAITTRSGGINVTTAALTLNQALATTSGGSGGPVALTATAGGFTVPDVAAAQDINAGSSTVALTAGGVDQLLTITGAVTGTGGTTYTADNMALTGATTATGATAILQPNTAGQLVTLGAADAAGTLGITEAELNTVAAATVQVGSYTSGTVTTSATIAPTAATSLVIARSANDVIFAHDVTIAGAGIGLTAQAGRTIAVDAGVDLTLAAAAFTGTINDVGAAVGQRGAGTAQFTMNSLAQVLTTGGNVTITRGTFGGSAIGEVRVGNASGVATISSGAGTIAITGTGRAGSSSAFGVQVSNGSLIQSTSGPITLTGTGGAGTSDNYGISVTDAATTITSATGNILLTGTGAGTTTANIGVAITAGADVVSSGAATVTLTGVAAAGTGNNFGIYIATAGSTVTSVDGNILMTGTGGAVSGDFNSGIHFVSGALVEATGNATVTLNGTGGPGGGQNYGLDIQSSGTLVKSANGNIAITGVAGNGTSSYNQGLRIISGSDVEVTGTGSITIIGTGSGTNGASVGNNGINFADNGTTITTNSGNITMTGTCGIGVSPGIAVRKGIVLRSTGGGAISMTGTGQNGVNGEGIHFISAAAPTIGNAADTGPITLTADTISMLTPTFSGTGAFTIKPLTVGTTIGIAGGAGTLNLPALDLAKILDGFSSITIGHATGTGNVTVNAATFTDPLTIQSPSGGTIAVNGLLTGTNASVTLNGAATSLGANIVTTGNAITISDPVTLTGNATLDSTNAGGSAAGATIQVTGACNADSAASNRTFTVRAGTAGVVDLGGELGTTQALQAFTVVSGASSVLLAITTRDGGVSVTTSAITLMGNISTDDTTAAGPVTLTGPVTLGAGVTIDSNAATTDANISFSSDLKGGQALILDSGAADISVAGRIGGIDTAWVDDSTPTGATLAVSGGDTWSWVGASPAPFSGSLSHLSADANGAHQHYFFNASQTLPVYTGTTLYAYVYLDPADPPSEVMLQWNDGTWEHRGYWGADSIPWGVNGTDSRRYIGALPATGQWVRLEVPASVVGLENSTLNGMAFTLFDGQAWFDKAGAITYNSPPLTSLTIPAAKDVTLSGTTYVSGNFTQTSGTGTTTFNGATLGGLAVNTVTTTLATASVTVSGSVAVNGGDFNLGSQTLTIGDDFTNNGTFNAGTGTVVFNDNTKTSTLTYSAATTFTNFTCITASKALVFDNVDQTNITGVFTLNGQATGTKITLRSDSNGVQFEINPTGARSVQYVDVKDSNNVDATFINPTNSTNSFNTTRWFSTVVWTGLGIDNDWTTGGNWDGGVPPPSTGTAVFNATGTKSSTANAAFGGAIGTVTISTGYTGTLTVASPLAVSGTFTQTAGGLDLGADLVTPAGAITTSANVTLSGNVTVDTTNAGGSAAGANITISGTINADSAASNRTLTLRAGTAGAISIGGTMGGSQALQAFTVVSGVSAALPAITTRDGGVSVTATAITLGGSIFTDSLVTAGAVSLTGPAVLGAAVTIDTNAATTDANISFSSTIDGPQALTLDSGTGTVTVTGNVGQTVFALTKIFLTNTAATTWTVPSNWNVNSNTIEVIGGGSGAGGAGGDFGGGGAYSKITNAVLTPGATVAAIVGTGGAPATAGGDTFLANSTSNAANINGTAVIVGAKGGGLTGGLAASGVGTTKYSGGNPGTNNGSGSGNSSPGGGGAAGPLGAGGNGGNVNPATAYVGGGGGGNGGGSAGTNDPGGFGGGTGGNNFSGTGGGSSVAFANGGNGTDGGGGGGGGYGAGGGTGGTGTEFDATHGSGGGGGGNAYWNTNNEGAGGLYGGGAGSCPPWVAPSKSGGQGLIYIAYIPFSPLASLTIVSASTVTFSGGVIVTGNFTQSAGTGTTTLNGATLGGLLVNTNTTTLATAAVTISGNFAVNGGIFNLGSQTLTIGDDFTNNGTFNAGTGTVVFNDNTKTSTLTYSAATTFTNFTCTTASKALVFDNVDQTNITGTFTLNGQANGTRITVRSDSAGLRFEINPTSTLACQYVDVQDSQNLGPALINPTNSNNSGNTRRWFPVVLSLVWTSGGDIAARDWTFNTVLGGTYNSNVHGQSNGAAVSGQLTRFDITNSSGADVDIASTVGASIWTIANAINTDTYVLKNSINNGTSWSAAMVLGSTSVSSELANAASLPFDLQYSAPSAVTGGVTLHTVTVTLTATVTP